MDRADVGDHRDLGLGDRRQLGDLAGAAHRHLEHEHVGVGRRLEHGQRQADLGVEVLAVGVDRARQQRPGDVLDRGLADRAGDPDHARAELAPPGTGQRLQRGQRVIDGEDPARPSFRSCSRRYPGDKRPERGAHDDAPGAGLDRGGGELAAVGALAAQAEEEVAGAGRAGVDRRPPRRAWRRPRRRTSAPIAAAICPASRFMPRRSPLTAAAAQQLLAGHLAVVEGDLATVLELLALLVALAGDHHRVARPARARRRARSRRAGRARTSTPPVAGPGEDLGDDRLRVLGARVVGGDDRQVGQPSAPALPIFGRLSRSRSPPAPKTEITLPSVSRRAAARTLSSESGVWA